MRFSCIPGCLLCFGRSHTSQLRSHSYVRPCPKYALWQMNRSYPSLQSVLAPKKMAQIWSNPAITFLCEPWRGHISHSLLRSTCFYIGSTRLQMKTTKPMPRYSRPLSAQIVVEWLLSAEKKAELYAHQRGRGWTTLPTSTTLRTAQKMYWLTRKIVQMTPQTILSFARFAGLSLRKQTQNLSHYVNTANPTIASFAK